MARTRTTKKLAQRIDLNYFKRPTAFKRARFWLSLLLPLVAIGWIAWHGLSRDSRVYSSGRLSAPHAVLEKDCAACHLQQTSSFSAKAADSACLRCHDGPIHHTAQLTTPSCSECHTEHRGRINILAARNQACAQCHNDLQTKNGAPRYAAHIRTFEDGHPQFAALRDPARDPSTIKLNHATHMRPIRRGPTGPIAQLQCEDCHRPAAAGGEWKYGDAKYTAVKTAYTGADENLPVTAETLSPRAPRSGRELMAPVKFSTACASCHLLTFDKRFDEGVPHDRPEVIHTFLVKKFQEYILAHPAETRVRREPDRDVTGKPIPAEIRVLTPAQWVAERTAQAEELLRRKTCQQCHVLLLQPTASVMKAVAAPSSQNDDSESLSGTAPFAPLQVAPASVTVRWMPHAKFDHDAHRAFTCTSCHAKALTSTQSSDVLLPGIATCRTCHAPGPEHAESRCFECHTYHDWSKRKEITPTFTLPAL